MNLFASFAANNSLWLLWYGVVLGDTQVIQQNEVSLPFRAPSSVTQTPLDHPQGGCAALHLILHYFLLTNYAWMLCEGFYLHTVLVSAFVSEKKLVRCLVWLGWGAPALVILAYGLMRGFHGDETDTIQ